MSESRTVHAVHQAEKSATRHLPLVDLLIDTRAELTELVVRSGMKVLEAMLEEDRVAVCGPRYAHQTERHAGRAGTTTSTVVLGGRKVEIRRPRVRARKQEVPLPTFTAMAHTDPLDRRIVEQMLLGVATRRYGRSLEPLPPEIRMRGTSKSSVSRRFVARTTAQVRAWQTASLDGVDLVAIFIDGVVFAEHCLVVALGIDATGQKHPLGLWDGSTENATVCQGLLSDLQSRGLRTDRSVLVILDGSKALRRAVDDTFGRAAWVQRCQCHKTRNVLEYLPDRQRSWVHAILRRAYTCEDPAKAQRLLTDLARRLEDEFPSAAESVREGLDETLTVLRLPLSARLRRSLATTNPIESLISRTRHVHRNVKRWRNGKMMIRWMTAAVFEAAKGFRRLKGCKDLPSLVAALRRRDEQLGLSKPIAAERVA
ncbi:MAG: IS256 family transposase [Chloroflexi bacterium]|nr:IS256 family transposase [Chloroflexota bacterium]